MSSGRRSAIRTLKWCVPLLSEPNSDHQDRPHLSHDEQRKRFLARIDEPDKNWKLSLADVYEGKHWGIYIKEYVECLEATSTQHVPWYAVPADDKENARVMISAIVLGTLKELKSAYPKTTARRRAELQSIRKQLAK